MLEAIGAILGLLGVVMMAWDNQNEFAFPTLATGFVLLVVGALC